jgi:hypothetical protein
LETICERIARIEFGEKSPNTVSIPGVSGRKTIVSVDVSAGSTFHRGKKEKNIPVQERGGVGPWASFCLGPECCHAALFSLFV